MGGRGDVMAIMKWVHWLHGLPDCHLLEEGVETTLFNYRPRNSFFFWW